MGCSKTNNVNNLLHRRLLNDKAGFKCISNCNKHRSSKPLLLERRLCLDAIKFGHINDVDVCPCSFEQNGIMTYYAKFAEGDLVRPMSAFSFLIAGKEIGVSTDDVGIISVFRIC